jgi:hypothetical protein
VVALVTFRNITGVSDLDGGLTWFSATGPISAPFAAAFTATGSVIGSAYAPPAANQPVFNFGDAGEKADLILSGGGINPDQVLPFTFDSRGHAEFSDPGNLRPSLTLSVDTGQIAGSVQTPGNKTATSFSGVVFPKQESGFGYFIHLSTGGLIELQPAN